MADADDPVVEESDGCADSDYAHITNRGYFSCRARINVAFEMNERAVMENIGQEDQGTIHRMVAEAMTTDETYFFRDPFHYDAIKTTLLPALKEERSERRKLSFWSAASSTGQEAYSLAMLLLEEGLRDWNIQILGTDVSSKVLERAKSGRFQHIEVNRGLPSSLLVKYFRRDGVNWQLSETVRRMAQFGTIDLRNSMRALGPFDLVFCRNVLINFDSETKLKILKEIHGTLFRGGWLLLGCSETASDIGQWYEQRTIGKSIVYIAR